MVGVVVVVRRQLREGMVGVGLVLLLVLLRTVDGGAAAAGGAGPGG